MRHLLAFVLMIALVGSVAAADLGNVQKDIKTNNHVGMNPGTPDGRDGGNNSGDAVGISDLPFSDSGNTGGNTDDWDEECPYGGSTSPDQWYAFTPAADVVVSVDLLGSTYDTKTYILDTGMNVVACNDDFYPDYVSFIEEAFLTGGETYYIVVDGYGGDFGDFVLNIMAFTPPEPCIIDCADDEGEPELVDGYADAFNGGCNSPEFGNPFSEFMADQNGDLTACGQAGWYITSDGGNSRDTDWYTAIIGLNGMVEWTLDAEQTSYGFLLGPNDCGSTAVVDQMLVGPCLPLTMVIQGAPGDIVWLWVGASEFSAPGGFVGNEYMYMSTFTGLYPGDTIATEEVTFDGIKSLYR